MGTNETNNTNFQKPNLIYPELSYIVTGFLFNVHNELGPYARERQYGDRLELKFREHDMPYQREFILPKAGIL